MEDYALVTALLIAVILVAQTTWAILDEGQGRHISEVPRSKLALVAKVIVLVRTIGTCMLTFCPVSYGQRSSMGGYKYSG